MSYANNILILGIGNLLMGDEGVGVHVAQKFQSKELPSRVAVVDGGTGGFHLLSYFELYPRIILIDATIDGRPAGTINLIQPKFAKDFPKTLSAHDIGLKDLVESASVMGYSPEIYLFTVSIKKVQPMRMTLSERIEERTDALLEKILDLIRQLLPAEKEVNRSKGNSPRKRL